MKKILCVVGARPNFIKIAPLLKQFRKHKKIKPVLVHTGQHYDRRMSEVFFSQLNLPEPDIHLGVGSDSHAAQTAKIMIGLEKVILDERPDLVIVVGDVNSTMAGALVAGKLSIPVAHVEAGLRSFDRSMPEEINRIVTDSLSDFLFTPSRDADENLSKEGIPGNKIHFVGNVMIDTLLEFKDAIRNNTAPLKRLGTDEKKFAIVTLHRPSNVDRPSDLDRIFRALSSIEKRIKIIFPVHPRTQYCIKKFKLLSRLRAMKNIIPAAPMGYIDFLSLIYRSRFVITDSGGIQEETTILGIPCLTVRENTERPVTVTEGTNTVVGTDPAVIVKKSFQILDGKEKKGGVPMLWDGKSSQRIVKILLDKGAL